MPPRVKIEETLPSGERITITLEGRQISKKRVLQILDMLDILSGSVEEGAPIEEGTTSMKERVWQAIVEHYGDGSWFTLKDLYAILVNEEPALKLTTLASYLAKFVNEGKLIKRGQKPSTLYRVRAPLAQVGD